MMVPVALCYCELVPMMPVAGGGMAFAFKAFNDKIATISGWAAFGAFVFIIPWEAIQITDVLGYLIPSLKEGNPLYSVMGSDVYLSTIIIGVVCSLVIFAINMRGLASAALLPLGSWAGLGTAYVNLCAFVVTAVCFWCAIRAYDGHSAPVGFQQVLVCLFGGVIIPLALAALVELRCLEYGKYLVLLAVLLTFVTDAGAYFAGVFLGRHRGVTQVSPNKSVEGYIGGFVSGVAFALLYGLVAGEIARVPVDLLSLALCGLFGALATEVGDLAFSFVKRQYGVKDFGHLLPGHGGMLDRFDSMLFCGPVVLFIVQCLPVFEVMG